MAIRASDARDSGVMLVERARSHLYEGIIVDARSVPSGSGQAYGDQSNSRELALHSLLHQPDGLETHTLKQVDDDRDFVALG